MALGLGIVVYWATQSGPAAAIVSAFKSRVIADGGTVESPSCAKSDVKFLLDNPVPSAFTGLLNDYSGAAAAYSLRLLDNTFTGDAIVVRRASDNTTQNIGFANNELDTASLESFCSGTDGFVTTWYDQSGNGNDVVNATASQQPKIVSAGSTILENGKAAVQFDGVNDYLKNTSIVSNQPNTYFVTAKYNLLAVLNRLFDGGVSGTTRNSMFQNANRFQYFGGLTLTGASEDNNQNLHYLLANGTSSEAATNGLTAYTGDTGSQNLNGLTLAARWDGAANFSDIVIQELVMYGSDQSTNRTGIETNINSHYNIYP